MEIIGFTSNLKPITLVSVKLITFINPSLKPITNLNEDKHRFLSAFELSLAVESIKFIDVIVPFISFKVVDFFTPSYFLNESRSI
jgi:hypothetical protein